MMTESRIAAFPVFDMGLLRGERGSKSDADAEWDRVFDHFQPRLLSYFKRRTDGILSLEDLLQEVWLRAFLNVRSVETSHSLWTWLITIGTNLLRDELRRNRPVIESLGGDHDHGADLAAFLGVALQSSEAAIADTIEEMRAKLTAEEWEFLNLLCVDNLSHQDVARRVGLKTAMASRQRLRRIRQRLLE